MKCRSCAAIFSWGLTMTMRDKIKILHFHLHSSPKQQIAREEPRDLARPSPTLLQESESEDQESEVEEEPDEELIAEENAAAFQEFKAFVRGVGVKDGESEKALKALWSVCVRRNVPVDLRLGGEVGEGVGLRVRTKMEGCFEGEGKDGGSGRGEGEEEGER
jgi:hypothetical protein